MEATTEAKPLTAKQQRAAEIKQRNKERIERLKAQKALDKKERAAQKAKLRPSKPQLDKQAKAAEAKARREAAAEELKPVAKEVNHRLDQAKSLDGKADDHRLAAALKLKEAEERCKAAGLNFKSWSEANVKGQSYETVRKLLAVGKSEDPPKALADLRAKNALANKELRERKKAEATTTIDDMAKVANKPQRRAEEPDVGANLPFDESIRPVETAIVASEQPEGGVLFGVDALKAAFNLLKASEKMAFCEWAALEIGATLTTAFDEAPKVSPSGIKIVDAPAVETVQDWPQPEESPRAAEPVIVEPVVLEPEPAKAAKPAAKRKLVRKK